MNKQQSSFTVYGLFTLFFILITFLKHANNWFYDDELANINIIEKYFSFKGIYEFINSTDVHPPGMYLLNLLIHKFLPIEHISIFSLIVLYVSMLSLIITANNYLHEKASLYFPFFLFISLPTILIYVDSVRWYGYYTPVSLLAISVILNRKLNFNFRLLSLTLFLVLLIHINYVAFFTIPLLFILDFILFVKLEEVKNKKIYYLKYLAAISVFTILCLPQFFYFITVHSKNSGSQKGSYLQSFLNTIVTVIEGNATFPLEPLGILFAISFSILGLFLLIRFFNKGMENSKDFAVACLIGFILIHILCFIITGIGIKFRNSAFLILPIQFVFFYLASKQFNHVYRVIWSIFLAISILFGIQSYYNVIKRTDTIKNNYNIPLNELLEYISQKKPELVCTHDPVISFYTANKLGIPIVSPYKYRSSVNISLPDTILLNKPKIIMVISTFRGSFTLAEVESYEKPPFLKDYQPVGEEKIWLDRWYKVKRKQDADFPVYTVKCIIYKLRD